MKEYGGFGIGGRKQRIEWLEDELRHWHVSLGRIGDRLVEIETRYSFYLSRLGARYTGESVTADQTCGDAVNRAFILYEEASRLVEEAEKKIESAGPISIAPLDQAHRMLTKQPLRVESGRGSTGSRVNVPIRNPYEASGRKILHDLGKMIEQATQALEEFRSHVSRAMALNNEVVAALANSEEVLRERAASGAGPADTRERLEQHKEASEALGELQRLDPIGASHRAQSLLAQIRSDKEEWRSGIRAVEILQDVIAPLAIRLQAEVGELGKQANWDPESVFEQARATSREIKSLIDVGKEQDALAQARSLETTMLEFEAEVNVLQNAKEGFSARLEVLRTQRDEVLQSVPRMKSTLEKVGNSAPNPAIIQDVELLLVEIQGCFERALSFVETDEFVAAWQTLNDAEALIFDCQENYSALVSADAELSQAMGEVDQLIAGVVKRLGDLQNSVTRSQTAADGVGHDVVESLKEFLDRSRQSIEIISAQGNGWLNELEDVRVMPERIELFEQMLRDLREAYQSHRTSFQRNEHRIRDLIRAIEVEKRDRAHVDEAGKALKSRLAEVQRMVGDPTISGDAFSEHVLELRRFFEDTQEIWTSELSLVMQAETALARARNHLNRIHARRFGNGIRANLNFAHQMVADVHGAMESRHYGEAIRLALDLEAKALAEETSCSRRGGSRRSPLYGF